MKKYFRRLKNRLLGHKKTQKEVVYRVIWQSYGDNREERRASHRPVWNY